MKDNLELKIIAKIKTDFPTKFGIPRQSGLIKALRGKIVFEPEYRNQEALRGLDGFSHLWLLWKFSESVCDNWSPTVRPPRLGGNKRMGVFATRSPFRPNPIGLSSVKLERIYSDGENGTVIEVSGADLMDGTPIFDIKPYLPYVDSIPEAKGGFSEEFKDDILNVNIPEAIKNRLQSEDIAEITAILSLNPKPQYQNDEERIYGLSYKNFEVKFKCNEKEITVIEIEGEKW